MKKIFTLLGYILLTFTYLLILVSLVYKIWSIDWGFLNSKITAYPIICDIFSNGDKECLKWKALEPIIYKVDNTQQFVIDDNLNRLKNCVVINRTNWKCEVPFGTYSSPLGFKDGEYFSESFPSFVSKWQWGLIYLGIDRTNKR